MLTWGEKSNNQLGKIKLLRDLFKVKIYSELRRYIKRITLKLIRLVERKSLGNTYVAKQVLFTIHQ